MFAGRLEERLASLGLPPDASPIFMLSSMFIVKYSSQVLVLFAPLPEGTASVIWAFLPGVQSSPDGLDEYLLTTFGLTVGTIVTLPLPTVHDPEPMIEAAVTEEVANVERETRVNLVSLLGDLTGVAHLDRAFMSFLEEHPDPRRNVFVMMRFIDNPQMNKIYATIKSSLAVRGIHATRADDRDYTGELWSNIEVYLTCCHLGIAVFEDIEKRDFNPNVSLELGYMLGRRRRCLILKEQRLPNLPADVVHRLYKPFDMFDISTSVDQQVGRWIDVDLGMGTGQSQRVHSLSEAERRRVRFELVPEGGQAYVLRNVGTDTAYGVHVDTGGLGFEDETTDFDAFDAGFAERYMLARTMGPNLASHVVVTWHNSPDRSDAQRSAKLLGP